MSGNAHSVSAVIRFDVFDADLQTQELRKHGVRLRLPGQSFQILKMLLERPGQLVTREEFQKALWPSDTFVDFDHSLNAAVNRLREALGDSAEEPRLVETLPRRGYRFVGAVRQLPRAAPLSLEKPLEDHRERPKEVSGKGRHLRRALIFGAVSLAILAVGVTLWMRNSHRPTDRSQWVALTQLPDPVSQPALSADGRMLAFVRGYTPFVGPGQVYVKILPDGQPMQLTHDEHLKMGPAFSPDGARIAYTVADPKYHWDTWVVPTLGGEPQPWLRNASGLVWSAPGRVLFSKIGKSPHMGIVTAQESRIGERDVYSPAEEEAMAHRSFASPDGKWVILVEMDKDHMWGPCRLVPMDGTSVGRQVGPPKAACTSGAWSPDGRWMYLSSAAGGLFHIWRQRFPDGKPEQLTSGPTEEEGIAMAPDGRSFVTAVTLESVSVWLHDSRGSRQISLEGNAADPIFTPDGRKLCYRIVAKAPNSLQFTREAGPLWLADLESGRSSPLVSDFPVLAYDISLDGRQVVLEAEDHEGKPRLWLTTFERQTPPQQIPNVEGRQANFGPAGEIFFRSKDGFAYRVRADGTGLRKALEQPILILIGVSPDGNWILAWSRLADGDAAFQAFPIAGGSPVLVSGWIYWRWSRSANFLSIGEIPHDHSYLVPLAPGQTLPPIPAGGFRSEEDLARLPGARKTDELRVIPGPSIDVYAFYRSTTQRNLYRIPVP